MRIMAGETATDDGVVSRSRFFTVGYLAQEPGVLNSATTLYAEAEGSFGDVLGLQKELESINSVLAEGAEGEHELDELLARQGELQHRLEAADVFTIRARVEKVLYGLGFSQADLNAPVRSFPAAGSCGWSLPRCCWRAFIAASGRTHTILISIRSPGSNRIWTPIMVPWW